MNTAKPHQTHLEFQTQFSDSKMDHLFYDYFLIEEPVPINVNQIKQFLLNKIDRLMLKRSWRSLSKFWSMYNFVKAS